MRISPLARFSAYGFLKNQRYFEPFLVLALLAKGLSFFEVGLLVAFKELMVNIVEIPSGAIADGYGRRRAMIFSFVAYIASFAIFAQAGTLAWFFVAMGTYALGDAFRTGTHKAMIFAWLRSEGRSEEGAEIYGYTRSWSKLGSALCGLIAAALVLASDDYDWIFYAAIAPYVLNIINFLAYPEVVDGEGAQGVGLAQVFARTRATMREAFSAPALRRILVESMGFEGVFHAVKDFLQPLLLIAAVSWLTFGGSSEVQRAALLIGPAYFLLHLLSSLASRHAHRFSAAAGGEDQAAARLWLLATVVFTVILGAGYARLNALLIASFMALNVMQNLWRPLLISRIDRHADPAGGATLLSIESQSRRFATMLFAPLAGWAVDQATRLELGGELWPIGALGLLISLPFAFRALRRTCAPGVS